MKLDLDSTASRFRLGDVDARKLITALGIEGRYQGNTYRGHCPNPSHPKKPGPGSWIMVVGGAKAGLHRCHAGCGMEGGPVKLVAIARGISNAEARQLLIDGAFVERISNVELAPATRKIPKQVVLTYPRDSYALWKPALPKRLYAALRYLHGRDFDDGLIETHAVCATMPDGPAYPGRIILPVIVHGMFVDFVARLYVGPEAIAHNARCYFRAEEADAFVRAFDRDDDRRIESLMKSIPKALSGRRDRGAQKALSLWGFDQLDREHPVVHVTEGIWGATALLQAGIPNVVAACGSNWTEERTALLRPWPKIVLVPDGGDAGRAMVERAAGLQNDHDLRVVWLDDDVQPDHLSRTEIRTAIRNARSPRVAPEYAFRIEPRRWSKSD